MTCPRCGYLPPHEHPADQITLICELCDRLFKAPTILALCPACAHHNPNQIRGEACGT